jgi:hypothetical protein
LLKKARVVESHLEIEHHAVVLYNNGPSFSGAQGSRKSVPSTGLSGTPREFPRESDEAGIVDLTNEGEG